MQESTSNPPPPQDPPRDPPPASSGWRGGRWLDRRFAASWSRGGVALLLLCLVVYVPGQAGLPPIDRDESRFAQASRQMAASGTLEGWVVPRIQDRPRLNKPPLIYWLQAASVRVLGDEGRRHEGIWVYRLPSLLAAVGVVLLTWRLGVRMFDARAAWLAGALLAVSPVFAWEAHQARADQVLVLTVVGMQWGLWKAWRGRRREGEEGEEARSHVDREGKPCSPHLASPKGRGRGSGGLGAAVVFWVCLALGVLTKGPIAPMVAGLTVLGLCFVTRRVRWVWGLRPVLGVVIVVAMVGPWVWAVGESVGWREYLGTVYDETIGRAAGAKEGHWGPPGYHLVLLPVLFWPGSLLTAAAVVAAVRVARRSAAGASASPSLFLVAWLLPSWVVFELVSTKLPHYTMPLYPAVGLLSARTVYDVARAPRPRRFGPLAGLVIWLLIGAVLTVAVPLGFAWLLVHIHGRVPVMLACAAAMATLAVLVIAARTHLVVRTHVCGIIAAGIAFAVLVGALLPTPALWLSVGMAVHIRRADPAGTRPIALVGYHEDSMVFLTRGKAQRIGEGDLPAWLAGHPDGLVVIDAMPGEDVLSNHPALRGLGRVSGINYSNGRPMDVVLAEAPP